MAEGQCIRVLTGNLAPGGAIAKITGKEGLGFTGKARVFDSEEEFVHAVEGGSIRKGEKTVIVLRYLGPKGGPGALFEESDIVVIERTNPGIRHARNAQTHQFDYGCGSRPRCGLCD
jgi:Dehydratase family